MNAAIENHLILSQLGRIKHYNGITRFPQKFKMALEACKILLLSSLRVVRRTWSANKPTVKVDAKDGAFPNGGKHGGFLLTTHPDDIFTLLDPKETSSHGFHEYLRCGGSSTV